MVSISQRNAAVGLNDPLRQRLNCKREDAHRSWHLSTLSTSFALCFIIIRSNGTLTVSSRIIINPVLEKCKLVYAFLTFIALSNCPDSGNHCKDRKKKKRKTNANQLTVSQLMIGLLFQYIKVYI